MSCVGCRRAERPRVAMSARAWAYLERVVGPTVVMALRGLLPDASAIVGMFATTLGVNGLSIIACAIVDLGTGRWTLVALFSTLGSG